MLVNRYDVIEEIGSGGMGTVFKGQDTQTQQYVAIKELKPDALANDKDLLERFRREGEALRQLNHPNIVKMIDAFEVDDKHYLILEYVDGYNLREAIRESALPIETILNMAIDMADALTRAHRLNIIHRDIKPENLLVDQNGIVKLTDFGVAHVGTLPNITDTNVTVGTLAYLSPEACHGHEIDARADIWSLGVVLFELVAHQRPFDGKTMGEIITQILTRPTPDLEDLAPQTPVSLIDLIYRMLNKNLAERIPSVRLVGAELEALLQGRNLAPRQRHEPADIIGEKTFVADNRFETITPVSQALNHNLPAQTTPFVGREAELGELVDLLTRPNVRLITILASGGMGKSRLSLELGEKSLTNFADGVYFVELAPLTEADDISAAIGDVLKYPFQQEERSPQQQLLDYLQNKKLLLILDNFEHLIEGASLTSDILRQAPQIKIVTTSRQALRQTGETVFHLGGLDFPDWETPEDALQYSAVKLFIQSARRVDPSFTLQTENLDYVARICRLVDGLPLGILLAAAWLDMLRLDEIADEIANNINFLEAELTDLPERQRSIHAVFEYSWNLLNDAERAVFMKASIFRGGFSREAIQKIAGVNLRVLQALVNKSLLRRDITSGRYEIHELLRQFGQEILEQSADYIDVRTKHSEYYLKYIAQLTPQLKGQNQLIAINAADQDLENIRAAWDWAVQNESTDLIETAFEGVDLFTTFRSHFTIGQNMFTRARAVWSLTDENAPLLAEKLAMRYPAEHSEDLFRLALAVAETHQDKTETAFCQGLLGHLLSHTHFNQAEGVPLIEQSRDGFAALKDDFYLAKALDDLGWSYRMDALYDAESEFFRMAIATIEESLAIRRKIGDRIGEGNSLRNLGGAHGGFGVKSEEPPVYWEEAKALAYTLGDRLQIAWNAALLDTYWFFRGEFAKSAEYDAEGIPYADDLNDPVVRGLILQVRSMRVIALENDTGHAQALIDEAYPPGSPVDFRVPTLIMARAMLACATADFSQVPDILRSARKIWAVTISDQEVLAWYMPICMLYLHHLGEAEHALKVVSLGLSHQLFTFEWAYKWPQFANTLAAIKQELGQARYDEIWEQGVHHNFNDTIALITE